MVRSSFIVSAFALMSAPAAAASYSATLSTPVTGRFIARDIVWNCGAAACQGSTQESRPAVLCQSLAKHAGHVESFVVDGRAFATSELERCNASTKAAPKQGLASN